MPTPMQQYYCDRARESLAPLSGDLRLTMGDDHRQCLRDAIDLLTAISDGDYDPQEPEQ